MTREDKYTRDVKGYEGLYRVNALGEVFSVKRNKMLSETVDKHGYVKYCLTKDGTHRQVKAHRIVAEAFIPNPQNKREVNHIDGDKSNNAVWNLEWTTTSENAIHSVRVGLRTQCKPVRIVETGEVFPSLGECAKAIGGDVGNISRCLNTDKSDTHKGFHFEWCDMEREEAIAMLKSKMDGSVDTSYEWAETVRMAIEALQSPTDDYELHFTTQEAKVWRDKYNELIVDRDYLIRLIKEAMCAGEDCGRLIDMVDIPTDVGLLHARLRYKDEVIENLRKAMLKQSDIILISVALRYLVDDEERNEQDRARAEELREQILVYGARMCDRPTGEVDAVEMYLKANLDLDSNKITLGEYEKRIEPLRHLHYGETPKGEWLVSNKRKYSVYCSICGHEEYHSQLDTCPNCGAMMVKEKE